MGLLYIFFFSFFYPTAFFLYSESAENKHFRVYANHVASLHLKILNRWGEKVFESNDINKSWDGIYQGILQPQCLYIYSAEITFLDKIIVKKNGTVQLIK